MRLGDRVEQAFRGGDVADLPAGEREGLAGGADADAALAHAGQRHQGHVAAPVEDDVLVDLVADGEGVEADDGLGDQGELVRGEDFCRPGSSGC